MVEVQALEQTRDFSKNQFQATDDASRRLHTFATPGEILRAVVGNN